MSVKNVMVNMVMATTMVMGMDINPATIQPTIQVTVPPILPATVPDILPATVPHILLATVPHILPATVPATHQLTPTTEKGLLGIQNDGWGIRELLVLSSR